MPMPFHMSLTGQTQKNISEGCCDMQGRENTILCQALNHEVYIPTDPQTGQPTGKRVHNPLTVTKVFDKASPLLFQALTSGETMNEVKMEFYRTDAGGKEQLYFSIKLENAIIVSIKPWIPNTLDPTRQSFTHMEDVSFTYSKILWNCVTDKTEAQDEWKVPK
jgi:type VI secretion system secreted protein Hcp